MHPVKTDEQPPPPPPPPPPPLQPPRSSFSCDRHPVADNFTAFCPSCLCERLCIPDHSSSLTPAAKPISKELAETNKQHNGGHEVRFSEEEETTNLSDLENDILEMEAKIDTIVDNLKSVNDRIDLDATSKKPSSSSSNFWSKKWKKWRSKHKNKEKSVVEQNSVVSNKISRLYDDTQSEIADYGLGRRSCDIGPRFSLDAGRVSVEEPKGPWDGYVIGRSFPKLPPMVGGEAEPGGSTQTREYYLNSSRRRKGLERSNSSNSNSNTMVVDHNPNNNNAKVSPSVDYNQIHRRRLKFHSIGGEKELAGDDDDDDDDDGDVSSVKKTWWRNLKVKVWGNHTSKNEDELRSRKLGRSNSSASWRNIGSNKCQGDEFVSEKNPDNGFLRFYLTPLRGSRNKNLKN